MERFSPCFTTKNKVLVPHLQDFSVASGVFGDCFFSGLVFFLPHKSKG